MPVLPLPLISALILTFLLLRSILRGSNALWLQLFLAACALQGVVLAFHHHYGWHGLRLLQPVTAMLLPPLAMIAFENCALRPFTPGRHGPLLLLPLATIVLVLAAPFLLDLFVPLVFAGCGAIMLWRLFSGSGDLFRTRLENGDMPARIWQLIALSFLLSAAADLFILYDVASGRGQAIPWIVGLFHGLLLLALGGFSLSQTLETPARRGDGDLLPAAAHSAGRHGESEESGENGENEEEERQLLKRLDELMQEEKPYLDDTLTLARLARRLGVPAKRLSVAINRQYGENVSRHVNRYRIDHACALLQKGENVTMAMLASGFATRSNFNREFRRLRNMAPGEWTGTKRQPE